jgi:ABC-type sugar transport system ATPase subunit
MGVFSTNGLIDRNGELNRFDHYVESISIKISGPEQLAEKLSGGNQQKVVLAKWLEKNAEILIFDEPTRGIDVGAKFEIYQWMNRLAKQGKGIIMISSELPEVLGMSDRIMVLKEGEFMGEVTNGSDVTQEKLMAMAIGIVDDKESENENS